MELRINLDSEIEISKAIEMLTIYRESLENKPIHPSSEDRAGFELLEMEYRTRNALNENNITGLSQLLSCTRLDLKKVPGLGVKGIDRLEALLAANGFTLFLKT